MDTLMLFGFLSTFLTFVFFIYRNESRASMIALAICLAATAAYGFLQGAGRWALFKSLCRPRRCGNRSSRETISHRAGNLAGNGLTRPGARRSASLESAVCSVRCR